MRNVKSQIGVKYPEAKALLEEVFENVDKDEIIEDLSPDNYFEDDNKILTLDDTRDYELFIKGKIVELSKIHPDEIKEVLSKFNRCPSIMSTGSMEK